MLQKFGTDGRTGGCGEPREDEFTGCARAERSKERLRRDKGEKLPLVEQLPTPPIELTISCSQNRASLSEGRFPGLIGGDTGGLFPGCLLVRRYNLLWVCLILVLVLRRLRFGLVEQTSRHPLPNFSRPP